MKKSTIAAFVTVLILGTVTIGWTLWGAPLSLEGTVKHVGQEMLIVTSTSEDGLRLQEISLWVNDETRFHDVASLGELKQGDQVKVSYKEEEENKIAISIDRQQVGGAVIENAPSDQQRVSAQPAAPDQKGY